MNNFLRKQREIVAIIAYVAVIFLLVYFVVLLLIEKINEANYQIQEEGMKQEIARQHINDLPKIQKQYEELENSIDLTDVLLDENEAVALIERLEKTAKETENNIEIEVQAQNDQKKSPAKTKAGAEVLLVDELPTQDYLQLKITLDGRYDSIVDFVRKIENFEYYCDITEVQINRSDDVSSARSGSEATNPFSFSVKKDEKDIAKDKNGPLSSSLIVVFYKKQK